jgi:hypothetical protein
MKSPRADQDSQGDLVTTNSEDKPGTQQEYFADVPVDSIQRISPIPDYTETTSSPHPILVKTPEGYFCLDGQGLIAQATESGEDKIRSYVCELLDHSEEELALRKVAVREKAPGGEPLYAERTRNVCTLVDLLSQSPDVRRYAHGGDRRGESFKEHNKLENVVTVISQRLGKSPTTINMLRSYGEYLDEPTLEKLVQERVTKDFFEKANANKRIVLKCLMHEGKSDAEITATISAKMLEWLREYKQTKAVKTVFPQTPTQDPGEQPSGDQSQGSQQGGEQPRGPVARKKFKHWSGNEPEQAEITFEGLKKEATTASDNFRTQLDDPGLQIDRFCELVTDQARRLMGISLKAQSLSDSSSSAEEAC